MLYCIGSEHAYSLFLGCNTGAHGIPTLFPFPTRCMACVSVAMWTGPRTPSLPSQKTTRPTCATNVQITCQQKLKSAHHVKPYENHAQQVTFHLRVRRTCSAYFQGSVHYVHVCWHNLFRCVHITNHRDHSSACTL